MPCIEERDADIGWDPARRGGAFAPYERFAAGKTSAQGEFISPEHLKSNEWRTPSTAKTQKERHKCGIFDHQWTAMGQTARLYKTEVVDESSVTSAGDSQCYLKGWAYMLRGEETEPLIAQIEAGIKKEVSVGCAVARSVCSICGQEAGRCAHRRGREYDGQLCYFTLEDPTDAYEWSFVAVPAQRSAGIIKSKRYGGGALEDPPGGEPGSDTWQDEALLELEKSRFMEVTSNET